MRGASYTQACSFKWQAIVALESVGGYERTGYLRSPRRV
jgi:hypothetical protein